MLFSIEGADIADYFNYGFTEDTWKLYCEKQRKMKGEVIQLNKIVVSTSQSFSWATPLLWYSKSNNLLVRIVVTLLGILLFEVSVCDVMMFINDWIVLDFCCMKCFSNNSSPLIIAFIACFLFCICLHEYSAACMKINDYIMTTISERSSHCVPDLVRDGQGCS